MNILHAATGPADFAPSPATRVIPDGPYAGFLEQVGIPRPDPARAAAAFRDTEEWRRLAATTRAARVRALVPRGMMLLERHDHECQCR